MNPDAGIPVTQIIDDLLNELAALSESPQTKAADFFEKITVATETLFSPIYFATIAQGSNNQNIFISGSESLSQAPQISEMATGSEFVKFLGNQDQPDVLSLKSAGHRQVFIRIQNGHEVWGGMVARFDDSVKVEPILLIFEAIREITNRFVAKQAEQQNAQFLDQFLRFSFNSHLSLNPKLVANHVANDARLILNCERLAILQVTRSRAKLLAISSVSSIESRSAVSKKMVRLVNLASRFQMPFFSDQPPTEKSVCEAMNSFQEASNFEFIVGVPLVDQSNKKQATPPVVGYLVAESKPDINRFEFSRGLRVTAPHISLALSNAEAVSRIPFRRSLSAIGKICNLSSLAALIVGLMLLTCLIGSLFIVKTDFKIRINGELRPEIERNVFASMDGFVEEVMVNHGDQVLKDQKLIELSSPALELELKQLAGEKSKLEKTLETKQIALNQAASGDLRDLSIASRLAGEISELEFELASLEDKKQFLVEQMAELVILSPIDGAVTTWKLKESILKKPVRWGESLANIALESGEWKINFKVPEYRIGYLLAARMESTEPLEIEFFFESSPNQKMKTRILEISPSTEMDPEVGPIVTVVCEVPSLTDEVDFAKRHGARVIADVNCGKKPVFSTWTQELFDSIKRRLVW